MLFPYVMEAVSDMRVATPEGTETKCIRNHDPPKTRRRQTLLRLRNSNMMLVWIDELGDRCLIHTCE